MFIIDDGDAVKGELERRKFTVEEGDHLTALNAYNAFVKCEWDGPLDRASQLTSSLAQMAKSRQSGATR